MAMKFLFVFVISTIALVFAEDSPSQEGAKAMIEGYIKKTGATCTNSAAVCDQLISTHSNSYSSDAINELIERCANIAKQYLCAGKTEGEAFAPVYEEFIEFLKKKDSLHN